MALAKDAIKSARAYLNDNNGITWTDSILMPLLQEAYAELIQDLDLNSAGVVKFQTPILTVNAQSLNLGTDQPSNILEPISMMERVPGTNAENFIDMIKVNFLPEANQTSALTYWSWMNQVISFIGSTATREVILRYKGYLAAPEVLTDPLGIIFAERFLGPRVAALCYNIAGKSTTVLDEIAERNKYKLIQRGVLQDQTPVRRRGYRSPNKAGRYGYTSVSVGNAGGSNVVTWIPTSTPADGIRTTFSFPLIPKQVEYNGVLLFRDEGYTLTVVSGVYTVTFIDSFGNILIPATGADIREQVA